VRPLNELLRKVKFKLFTSEYMRVAYLHPRSVVLVTVRHANAENVLPLDWHIPLSFFPKLYGISLESGNYSSELIAKSGVFAVNFMPAEFEHEILAAGRTSGRNTDKFALTNLSRGEGKALPVPVLNDAVGVLECTVVQTVETGDHTLFVGKVVREQFNRHAHHEQLFHVTRPGSTAGPKKPIGKGDV
jgi:flavin reductase (DIM6/NTAB) family NADH-FMN oxidoreductase RutF